jgi:phenylacetate-CoA ligase
MSILQRVKLAIARRRLSSQRIAFGSDKALEVWEENKVRNEFKRSPELRKAIGRDELGTIGRRDMREYQLHKFRQQMAYVMENSYYYKHKFEAAGIRPEDIRTWDDLQKVPITEPADLAAEPFTFLCVSQSKVMRVFSTSGTTGTRKRLFYTQKDGGHDRQGHAADHVPGGGGLGPRPHAGRRLQGGGDALRGIVHRRCR